MNILLYLENKTRLNVRYFIRNQTYLSLATFVDIVSGFILSIFFARYLNKTVFGQYSLIFSIITILSITKLSGLQSVFPYAISKGRESFYPRVLRLSSLGSFVGSIILVFIAFYYSQPAKPEIEGALLITALIFPFINAFVYYPLYLSAKKRFDTQAIFSAAQSIIPNFFIVLAVIFNGNVAWIISAALIPQAILNLLFTYLTLKQTKNTGSYTEDIRYGLKLSVAYAPHIFSQSIDSIILAKFLGFEQLANYTFATNIFKRLTPFIKNLEAISIPKIGEMSEENIRKELPKKILMLTVLTAVFCAGYILLAPSFFRFFYPQYLASVFPSQVFSLYIIFYPFAIILQSFHKLRLFKEIATLNFTVFLIRVGMLLFMIPRFGMMGAVVAFVLDELIRFLIAFYQLKNIKASSFVRNTKQPKAI